MLVSNLRLGLSSLDGMRSVTSLTKSQLVHIWKLVDADPKLQWKGGITRKQRSVSGDSTNMRLLAPSSAPSASQDPNYYLAPGFNPLSVQTGTLRGILLEFGIYNADAKKADMVRQFNEKIKPLAERILSERLSVKASSAGIIRVRTPR
jgi:hypothetical protein